MTRDEAITIVGMIANGWPGAAWEAERMEMYVEAIMALDAGVTTRAVLKAQQKLRYRPSIAELREFIQVERRLSESDEVRYMPLSKIPRPAWVERWARARAAGDRRPFPEQLSGLDKLARQSPEDYAVYAPPEAPVSDRSVWVQPDEYLDGDEGASGLGAIVALPDVAEEGPPGL